MNVDVFGRRLIKVESNRGVPGIGYKLTKDGQFDVERKKISNLADASSSSDAVNLKTLLEYVNTTDKSLRELIKNCTLELESKLTEKINELTEIVEGYQDDIDKKLLDTDNTLLKIQQGLDTASKQAQGLDLIHKKIEDIDKTLKQAHKAS